MGAYLRTSRNTGISLPWWLAIPAGLIWLAVMVVVLFYGLIALAVVWGVKHGRDYWLSKRWAAPNDESEG